MSILSELEIIRFHWAKRPLIDAIPAMTLSYMDLTCMLSGEAVYFYNDREILLRAGDAILFPPGSRRVRMRREAPVQYASFNVLIPKELPLPRVGHLPGCVTPTLPTLLDLFLVEYNSEGPYAKERRGALFTYLLMHLTGTEAHKQNPHVLEIERYIHQNLSSPLSVGGIAQRVHLAPEYCCELFKRHTGKTLVTYITEKRMERAKSLLRQEGSSIREVAALVGFSDATYFSKVFSRYAGMPPRDYLRSLEGIR